MKSQPLLKAGRTLKEGGVVAYPTEGVFGLGCLPESLDAVARILAIKRRDPGKGLLLIAAGPEQLAPWIADHVDTRKLTSSLEHPTTWIVDKSEWLPYWISGDNEGVAVRITRHPVAAALCEAADSALVSTSANVQGRQPARNTYILRRSFRDLVDDIVPGRCGPASGPSEIRFLDSGKILRATNQ